MTNQPDHTHPNENDEDHIQLNSICPEIPIDTSLNQGSLIASINQAESNFQLLNQGSLIASINQAETDFQLLNQDLIKKNNRPNHQVMDQGVSFKKHRVLDHIIPLNKRKYHPYSKTIAYFNTIQFENQSRNMTVQEQMKQDWLFVRGANIAFKEELDKRE